MGRSEALGSATVQRQSVSIGGERFEVHASGEGPLVLCLHGFPDLPATWAPVMERLAARGYRCAAPYLRGHAPSTIEGPFDVDQLGDDAIAIARALSPERPAFVLGHDWGALAAYSAIARAPELFRAAVTVSVPHPATLPASYLRHPKQLARSWYIGFFQLPRLPERALAGDLVERLWRAWSPGYEAPREHLDSVARMLEESEYAPLSAYRSLPRSYARCVPRWPRIRVPTLYLHGTEDGCIAPALARGQERAFDAPHRAELVSAGHFAPLEAPDRVAELVLNWIARW